MKFLVEYNYSAKIEKIVNYQLSIINYLLPLQHERNNMKQYGRFRDQVAVA